MTDPPKTKPAKPSVWIRVVLTLSVIGPALAFIGLYLDLVLVNPEDIAKMSGPGLCGMPILVMYTVLIIWLEIRIMITLDADGLKIIVAGCVLGIIAAVVTLISMVGVLLGWEEGKLHSWMWFVFPAIAVYFALVGLGHLWCIKFVSPSMKADTLNDSEQSNE